MSTYIKDPDAVLDHAWDWSAWLADDETIVTHDIIVTSGQVTIDSSSEQDGVVTAWLSGAEPRTVRVTCRVTTSQGRVDDRTITLRVQDR